MSLLDQLTFGTCYYPEHWPEEMWEKDLVRMKEVGFEVVRLGEGAWGYFEPQEGKYQFETFDRVLDLCSKHGMKVIFGTPTYCGPAWIATQYPEVLRWDFNRVPMKHGSRRNYNYTSPKYLDLSDRICTALAERYKAHPAIVGWQLDNEFNCHMDVSYAPSDTLAFRAWVREKYQTLDKLNEAWGTRFWSQQYTSWEQIDLPHPTATYLNPTLLLDETRFISDCVVRFAERQAAILRRANPRWEITHNHLFANIDGPKLFGGLSFYSHDHYPLFNEGDWKAASMGLMLARSLSEPFCIMEHQSGPGGQMAYLHRSTYPGELRRLSWQSLANGTRGLLYFLWRTCPFGSEQFWHGLHDQDDKPTRRLAEVRQVIQEASSFRKALEGRKVVRCVGILRDFDTETNERRIDTYLGKGSKEFERWAGGMLTAHVPVNYVWPDGDFTDYRLLIAPHLQLLTPELAAKLRAYVQNGGTLVLTARSGLKDANNHVTQRTPPGLLADLVGAEVDEWTMLPEETPVDIEGIPATFSTFGETLRLEGAEPVGRYTGNHPLLQSRTCATMNRVGKGKVLYLGGYISEAIADKMALWLVEQGHLTETIIDGENVEAVDLGSHVILINHGSKAEVVEVPPVKTVMGAPTHEGKVRIEPNEVAILERY